MPSDTAPGGGISTGTGKTGATRDGCIIVASSDESVKFHEVWTTDKKTNLLVGGVGMLGGSSILESLEGIDREGDIIR